MILGLILLISFDYHPESYKYWLFLFSIIFLGYYGIVLFFEGTKQRYKISKAPNTGKYDSDGEKQVADYFIKKKIKFYVHPVVKIPKKWLIFDNPFKNIKLHPDFFLPEYNVYVEYWGMINNNEKYREYFNRKRKAYNENNIEFISLYPKNLNNLDWIFTQKFMDLTRTKEGINTFNIEGRN